MQGAETPRSRRAKAALLGLVLVAATLTAYLPAVRSGFIWDDDRFLTDNPLIKDPGGLRLFWFSAKPLDYFPLTSTMLWFEWRLWHMSAAGYHAMNVLLHAGSAVLLWRVLARIMVPGPAVEQTAAHCGASAWLAGLLFALHPVCVESVAWITERKNTLPLPLFLASLLLYLRFEENAAEWENEEAGKCEGEKVRSWESENDSAAADGRLPTLPLSHLPTYLASLLLFLLALLAKTSVVMLPLVLLLCAWWRRGRVSRRDLLRAAPFFALAATLALVTMWYQHFRAIGGDVIRTDDFLSRAGIAGWAVWFYLCKAVLPVGLCFVYPRFAAPEAAVFSLSHLLTFLPAALLIAGLVVLWRERRKDWARACLLASAYCLAALLPVLGFVNIYFMKYSLVADHWQYAALIGPVALAAAALCLPGRTVRLRTAAAVGIVLLFGALTWRQCHVYHDAESLWRDTVRKNPGAWIAWNGLAQVLTEKGEETALRGGEPEKFYKEAIRDCDRALALHPHAQAWTNRADALMRLRRFSEAAEDAGRAIALDGDLAEAWNLRGNARAALREFEPAIRDYTRTLELRPDLAAVWFNRANTRLDAGHFKDAADDYREALKLHPNFPAAQAGLAAALRRMEEQR